MQHIKNSFQHYFKDNAKTLETQSLKSVLIIISGLFVCGAFALNYLMRQADSQIALSYSKQCIQVLNEISSAYTNSTFYNAIDNNYTLDAQGHFSNINAAPTKPPHQSQQLLSIDNALTKRPYRFSKHSFNTQHIYPLSNSLLESAWKQLALEPNKPFVSISEKINAQGEQIMFYAQAQILTANCLPCHNSDTRSAKQDWLENQLISITAIQKPIRTPLHFLNIYCHYTLVVLAILLLCICFYLRLAFVKINKAMAKSQSQSGEIQHQLDEKDDQNKQLEAKLNLAREDIFSEITKQNLAKQQLETYQKLNRTVLSEIAHEIKTPLHTINSYLQLLRDQAPTDHQHSKPLTVIQSTTDHLIHLSNDVLDLTKLEIGNYKLRVNNFNLVELCQTVFDMFKPIAEQRQLAFSFDTDISPENLIVNGDSGKLKQVLINLIANAIKYTAKGKVTLILTMLEDSMFNFQIIDTGIGIAEQYHDQIFAPFKRLSDKDSSVQLSANQSKKSHFSIYQGAGLGLSIVDKCLKLMHSQIKLDSFPARGSRFSFDICLPIDTKALNFKVATSTPAISLSSTPYIKLLIIDNLSQNRQTLKQAIIGLNVSFFEVNNDAQAIATLELEKIDLVLVNLNQTHFNLGKLLNKITRKFPDLAVIGTCNSDQSSEFNQELTLGLHRIIEKPYKLDQVSKVIASTLDINLAKPKDFNLSSPPATNYEFKLSAAYSQLIIEQCDLYLIKEVEIIIERLSIQFPNNERYFLQLQHFVNNYDLEGLTSFLKGDTHA